MVNKNNSNNSGYYDDERLNKMDVFRSSHPRLQLLSNKRKKRRHCECVKEAIEKQVSVVNAHATSQNLNWECVGWQALPGQIYANEISAEVKG